MVTKVRHASRFGTCDVLGEVINETSHAYIFRRPDAVDSADQAGER